MDKNGQLRMAIEQAKATVAEQGYEGADLRQVMLAGFGYVADQIEASERGTIKVKLEGKKFFAIGAGIGSAIAGAAIEAFRRFTT